MFPNVKQYVIFIQKHNQIIKDNRDFYESQQQEKK